MPDPSTPQAYIELFKLLKLAGLAYSGGEAKHLIDEGLVQVNGELELRRRRKLRRGDRVRLDDQDIAVDDWVDLED